MGALSVKTVEQAEEKTKQERSYALDFLKLIFTLLVMLCHTDLFRTESTRITFPSGLGFWSVHFFFIVSGMLMANSLLKREQSQTPGRDALDFIRHKFSLISSQYWTALAIAFVAVLVIYVKKGLRVMELFERIVPELFLITYSGADTLEVNPQTWYISAMFLAMFPLSYMLIRNRDFFVNVFAPLFGLMSYGYIYMTFPADGSYPAPNQFTGLVMHGVLRALCFLCLGVVAYSIAMKLREKFAEKKQRIFLTILELVLYVWIFVVWFTPGQSKKSLFSVMLLMPAAIAVTFSGKSYSAEIFRARWMKYLAPVSLMLYLNHFAGRKIVQYLMDGLSYKESVAIMLGFTAVFCIIYAVILKLCRYYIYGKSDRKN